MNEKKWIKIFFIISLFSIVLVGIINFIIDPFHQYKIDLSKPIAFTNERYQNAGLAKNLEYDSIVLGTSMTENFVLSEVESYLNFGKVLKLSLAGSSAKEQSTTLQTAIDNNKQLKNVLWGLDTFAFVGNPDRLRYGPNTFPFYLYDNNYLNDYKYIFSLDTLYESISTISQRYSKNKDEFLFDYNLMYKWQRPNDKNFTTKNVQLGWKNRNTFINYDLDKQSFEFLKRNFDTNFLSIIRDNPKIDFKIFFPPYSVLAFKTFEERNLTKDIIEFKSYIYSVLSIYKNVKIYDFQFEKSVFYDLNNYKDLYHYHEKINTWILQQIQQDNYLVKNDNIDEYLGKFEKEISEYDLKEVEK